MSELILSKTHANNLVFQLMGELADMVAHKVVERLQEADEFFNKTITVEAKSIEEDNPNELLNIKEVCRVLKIKRGALYDWRKKEILIPDTYIGNSPRYKKSSIDGFINNVELKK